MKNEKDGLWGEILGTFEMRKREESNGKGREKDVARMGG